MKYSECVCMIRHRYWLFCNLALLDCEDTGPVEKTFTLLQLGIISWLVNITVTYCLFAQYRQL